jgi:hypothetical protein
MAAGARLAYPWAPLLVDGSRRQHDDKGSEFTRLLGTRRHAHIGRMERSQPAALEVLIVDDAVVTRQRVCQSLVERGRAEVLGCEAEPSVAPNGHRAARRASFDSGE